MFDTHCHLNFKAFQGQVKKVIDEAGEAGIKQILIPGTNLATSRSAVRLAQKHKNVYSAVGIHPHHAKMVVNSETKKNFKKLVQSQGVVAIGECGLDYYQYQKTKYKDYKINKKFKLKQKEVFNFQIKIAYQLELPLIIHNRQASEDVYQVLSKQTQHLNRKGVIHCFQGDEKLRNWAVETGFYIGITGIVTFSKRMQDVVKKTSLDKLLIETDAPYLTPEPVRQQKKWPNSPKNVKIVAERIAQIKGDSFLNIVKKTTANAKRLFRV